MARGSDWLDVPIAAYAGLAAVPAGWWGLELYDRVGGVVGLHILWLDGRYQELGAAALWFGWCLGHVALPVPALIGALAIRLHWGWRREILMVLAGWLVLLLPFGTLLATALWWRAGQGETASAAVPE